MGQVPREAQSIRDLTNFDSVPLNVIVCKHFNERSFHQREKKVANYTGKKIRLGK